MLARAIIQSRFAGDTGSARFRQLAVVTLILAEHKRGRPPTVSSLAQLVDSHRSLINALINTLHARGLVLRTPAGGYQPAGTSFDSAQHNSVLDVRTDAIEAFSEAHLRETGRPLDLSKVDDRLI
jgi:DNA-binding IclR family transcriptional regulator